MRIATLYSTETFWSSLPRLRLLPTRGALLVAIAFGCSPEGDPLAPVSEYAGTWTLARVKGKTLPAIKSISEGTPLCCGVGTMDLESVTVTEGTLVIYRDHMATLDYNSSHRLVTGGASGSAERRVLEWDEKDGGLRFFESKPCNNSGSCPTEALVAEATLSGSYLEFSHTSYVTMPSFITYMNTSSFMRKPRP